MDYTKNKTVNTSAMPNFAGKKKKMGKAEMMMALKKKAGKK